MTQPLEEGANHGGRANKTGSTLENTVEDLLVRNGYERTTITDWPPQLPAGKRFYARQVKLGMSIYGSTRRMDFAIWGAKRFPNGLIIECKWQQGSGSVDEKFPFSVLNIEKIQAGLRGSVRHNHRRGRIQRKRPRLAEGTSE